MEDKVLMLKMEGVSKSFPGVKALDKVNILAYGGEVTALMGENGAGKSTLMKVLSGVHKKDEGEIYIQGEKADIRGIKSAEEYGVTIIHQELSIINNLTVAENIFLGNEKVTKGGRIDKKILNERSKAFLEQIGCQVNPNELAGNLNVGEKQMVEIAKALTKNAAIIIFDEPTTALTEIETKNLFKVIESLKKKGLAIMYISHRMEEIFAICDRVEVLRDGQYAGNAIIKDIDNDILISMMVGRKIEEQFPYKEIEKGNKVIEVENLSSDEGKIKGATFNIKSGEILGVAGLMGSGRTELAKTIFGAYKKTSGTIKVNGEELDIKSIQEAIDCGICYLSEDRKKEGCILSLSVAENMTLCNLKKYENKFFSINKKSEKAEIDEYIKKIRIKTPSRNQLMKNLSGGNQQKVILAKWIMLSPELLIIDEPTRGIDVGAKKEIYELLNELKAKGKAIMLISSDMPEVLGISDRVMVMSGGCIAGELSRKEATQEKIMKLAIKMV
ncbi:MAG: sugar ABC transporter ATP-binding protein [Clostridium sp.]